VFGGRRSLLQWAGRRRQAENEKGGSENKEGGTEDKEGGTELKVGFLGVPCRS
jgi:hypothetical protein